MRCASGECLGTLGHTSKVFGRLAYALSLEVKIFRQSRQLLHRCVASLGFDSPQAEVDRLAVLEDIVDLEPVRDTRPVEDSSWCDDCFVKGNE